MTRLAGKVALVTGASQGIGAGIARRFAAEGAAVIVHHTDDAQGATRVAADIVWRGGRAIAVRGDIAHWPDIRRIYEETLSTFGGLDILVNNTGLDGDGVARPMKHRAMSADERARHAELQSEATIFGAMLMSQEAVRLFGEAGGSIINLTSLGRCGMAPAIDADDAPEAAIDAMTRGLTRAFATRNIRVNSIAPGVMGPEEPAAIDTIDGSVLNRQFIAMPLFGRSIAQDAVATLAVTLACDDVMFRRGDEPRLASAGLH
jgi:3-oxoacyl-[acyl-carrier protein] reductase